MGSSKSSNTRKRKALRKGLVFYVETRRNLDGSKMVGCEVYVQVCYESDLEYEIELVEEHGTIYELTPAEFVTRYEDKMEEWVASFINDMKLYHNIDCHVEYWY